MSTTQPPTVERSELANDSSPARAATEVVATRPVEVLTKRCCGCSSFDDVEMFVGGTGGYRSAEASSSYSVYTRRLDGLK